MPSSFAAPFRASVDGCKDGILLLFIHTDAFKRLPRSAVRRLQVQERLTVQIRDCIQDTLKPLGVAVVIEASHTCMTLRGVQKANAVTTTSAFSGIFLKDERTRNEFLNLIK